MDLEETEIQLKIRILDGVLLLLEGMKFSQEEFGHEADILEATKALKRARDAYRAWISP